MSLAFHWYSEMALTTIGIRLAATVPCGACPISSEHAPAVTVPTRTLAVLTDRSVAKLTMTLLPTRSVRYGQRVNWAAEGGVRGVPETAEDCAEAFPAESRARTV